MNENGVWRTIRGRRVFIKDGEDLSSAMKRSGKFDNLKREDVVKTRKERAREIDKINKISKEEYDKTPKDYKGTLKELVDTAEFRGESKEKERQYWESKGYDVDKDKTILKYENGGTTLQPVKIEDSSPMSEWSDTTGSGYSDLQMKSYKSYLKSAYGTDDESIINAGKPSNERVSIEKYSELVKTKEAKVERFKERKGKNRSSILDKEPKENVKKRDTYNDNVSKSLVNYFKTQEERSTSESERKRYHELWENAKRDYNRKRIAGRKGKKTIKEIEKVNKKLNQVDVYDDPNYDLLTNIDYYMDMGWFDD